MKSNLRKRFGISKKLVILFIVLAVIPMISFGLIMINYYKASKVEAQTQYMESLMKHDRKRIVSYWEELFSFAEMNAANPFLKDNTVKLTSYSGDLKRIKNLQTNPPHPDGTEELKDLLEKANSAYDFQEIFILDNNGKVLFTLFKTNESGFEVLSEDNNKSAFAKSVRNALNTQKTTFSDFVRADKEEGIPYAFITSPIKDNENTIGLISYKLAANHLGEIMFMDEENDTSAESYLIGEDLLIRTALQNNPSAKLLEKKIETPTSEYFFKYYRQRADGYNGFYANSSTVNYAGKKVLVVASLLGLPEIFNSDFDLLLINEIEIAEINATANALTQEILIMLIVFTLIILIAAIIFAKMYSKPIIEITNLSKEISNGNFYTSIDIKQNSEIGDLAKSIMQMKQSLLSTVQQAEKIAEGDYSQIIELHHSKDVLAIAINQMTRDLREKDQFTSGVLNSTQAGVVLINSESQIIEYANPFALEILDYPEEEVLNYSYSKFFSKRSDGLSSLAEIKDDSEREFNITTGQGVSKTIIKKEKKILIGEREIVILTFNDISHIKNLQDELIDNENKYHSLFEESPAAIVITDANSNLIDTNNRVEEWLGYKKEEIIGKNIFRLPFLPSRTKAKMRDAYLSNENDNKVISYDVDFLTKSGELKVGSVHINRVYDKIGNLLMNVITLIDITEQSKAKKEIQAQGEKFRAIFDSVSNANLIIRDGKFIDCNEAAVRVFEMESKEEFLISSPVDISPAKQKNGEDSQQKSRKKILEALENGTNHFEWMHKRKNGELFPSEVILTRVVFSGKVSVHASLRDISDRKIAQKEIKDTKNLLQQVMNASSPICSISRDYKITGINSAMLDLLDLGVEEAVINKRCFEVMNLKNCGTEECMLKQCLEKGDRVITEINSNFKKGEITSCRINANPIRNDEDEITGIVENIIDITEIRLQQQEILENHEIIAENNWLINAQKSFDNELRGDFSMKMFGKKAIHYLSRFVEAQFGTIYTFDQEANHFKLAATYLVPEENCREVCKGGEGFIGQAAEDNEIIYLKGRDNINLEVSTSMGNVMPNQLLIVPFSFHGRIMGVMELATINEFTSKHINFLRSITDDLAVACNLVFTRQETKQLLSETQQQAAELEVQQEELRVANETLEQNSRNLQKASNELQNHHDELKAINEELEEKSDFLEKNREVIKKKNEVLEVAKVELKEKAEKLAIASKYKSEFLANMSHELRTPLNSLLILSNNLAKNKKGNLSEKQVEASKIINSSGRDLLNLINEILDLSKIEAGKMEISPQNFSLSDLKQNIIRNFSHQFAEKNLEMKFEEAENLPVTVFSDIQRLQQIIKNLISNALKFTSSGFIALKFYQPDENEDLSRSGLQYDQAIAIAVQDSGIGIKPEKVDIIFEAFQQEDGSTSRKYGGTGLGLSISSQLIKLLGGEIKVKSKVGEGSTFTLYIPITLIMAEKITIDGNNELHDSPKTLENLVASQKSKIKIASADEVILNQNLHLPGIKDDRDLIEADDKTVLVIEDDLKFAAILKNIANEKGIKCIHAANGESGLDLVSKYMPNSIILDINLPGINGWKVLEMIKDDSKLRHIPVHIMSGDDAQEDYYDKGAVGYLTKPVDSDKLDDTFDLMEEYYDKKIKKILIIEDNVTTQKVIKGVISGKGIELVSAMTGSDALDKIKESHFDCAILDIGLPDINGFDILQQIKNLELEHHLPVIIYTGKDLSRNEEKRLRKYSQSIIVKGERSNERLVDEVALYLHQVVEDLPKDKQDIIKMIHNKDQVFVGKNVLVVDDDIRNVFAVTGALEEYEINVYSASNGKEAIEVLEESKNIDLILMDIMMPIMDGYEAMEAIRANEEFKKMPIIALTAKAMRGDKDKCIAAGANDYLAKPLDIDRLLSMMRIWIYK